MVILCGIRPSTGTFAEAPDLNCLLDGFELAGILLCQDCLIYPHVAVLAKEMRNV